MTVKRLPKKVFNEIYSKVPRLGADVVIRSNEGILLTKRAIPKCKGMWHIPGGTLLKGEKIIDCVKRVAKLETGLTVKVKKFIGLCEYTKRSSYHPGVALIYLVEPIKGKLKIGEDTADIKFFKKIPKNTIKEQRDYLYTYFKMN